MRLGIGQDLSRIALDPKHHARSPVQQNSCRCDPNGNRPSNSSRSFRSLQQPHLEDNTQAWLWKAVPMPKIQTKKRLGSRTLRTAFYLSCYFWSSCDLSLDTAVNRWV